MRFTFGGGLIHLLLVVGLVVLVINLLSGRRGLKRKDHSELLRSEPLYSGRGCAAECGVDRMENNRHHDCQEDGAENGASKKKVVVVCFLSNGLPLFMLEWGEWDAARHCL